MRHTDAPGGAGDPAGFRVDDCATQRNLSAKGRADALRIGARLKSEGIAVERLLSSPWCRCIDTATLLELGPVETSSTFGNVVVLSDQREALTAGARAVIDKWAGSGILLVVTHGANIAALTGISPASGEIVVVRSGSGGSTNLSAAWFLIDRISTLWPHLRDSSGELSRFPDIVGIGFIITERTSAVSGD